MFFASNFFLVSITMQTRFGSSRECGKFSYCSCISSGKRHLRVSTCDSAFTKTSKFSRPLCDAKYVYDVMKNIKKNVVQKTFFIEISDSKFTFFMGIWRSLNPSSCLLLACDWLKYDYGTFSPSLGVAKHVRIWLKNITNFRRNKSFHRNFWLKFEFSHGAITRKVPYVTTLSVKKFFLWP